MSSHLIADGVWHIYTTRQDGKRVLDGKATDSDKARQLFRLAVRDEPARTMIELVDPRGEIVETGRSSPRQGLAWAVLLIPKHLLVGLGVGVAATWMSFDDTWHGR